MASIENCNNVTIEGFKENAKIQQNKKKIQITVGSNCYINRNKLKNFYNNQCKECSLYYFLSELKQDRNWKLSLSFDDRENYKLIDTTNMLMF